MKKATTIYLDVKILKAVKIKAVETHKSVSKLVNEALPKRNDGHQSRSSARGLSRQIIREGRMKIITMSTRGRIVIPHNIRKVLHIKKGTRVQIMESDGQIILVPEKSN